MGQFLSFGGLTRMSLDSAVSGQTPKPRPSTSSASLSINGHFMLGRSRQGIGIEVRYELDEILALNDSEAIRQSEEKLTLAENRLIARRQLRNKGLSLVSLVERKLEDYFTIGKPLTIQILRPESGRITDVVTASLTASLAAFVIHEDTFNAGNPESVAAKIRAYGSAADIDFLCVVRGGGKEQIADVFNAPTVLDALGNATLPIIAAIGHHDDVTLFHKYADESFHTPTALGAWLNGKYEEVKERTERVVSVTQENARLKAQIERITGIDRGDVNDINALTALNTVLPGTRQDFNQPRDRHYLMAGVITIGLGLLFV